jgi:signal transduction protein with GAF and PtsI domain
MHRPNEEYIVQKLTSDKFLRDIEKAFPKVRTEIQERDEEMWDEYLQERLAEIEENLDEFMDDLEDFTPPFVEIDTDDFDVHVGGKGSQDEDS